MKKIILMSMFLIVLISCSNEDAIDMCIAKTVKLSPKHNVTADEAMYLRHHCAISILMIEGAPKTANAYIENLEDLRQLDERFESGPRYTSNSAFKCGQDTIRISTIDTIEISKDCMVEW